MFNRISKMLAVASVSTAVALGGITATATPAQADNEDLRRFLGGAAALIVLGAIINEHNDRRDPPHYSGHPRPHPHPQPNRHDTPSLIAPSACFHMFRGPHGNHRAFGVHCMHDNVRHVNLLPSSCIERVFTYQGWRQVYDAQCLRRHGWSRS